MKGELLMRVMKLVVMAMLMVGLLSIPVSAIIGPREHFVLRTMDSYVAVFRSGDNTEPYIRTNINEQTLPDSDRLLLSMGIQVDNETELWSILEDLGP